MNNHNEIEAVLLLAKLAGTPIHTLDANQNQIKYVHSQSGWKVYKWYEADNTEKTAWWAMLQLANDEEVSIWLLKETILSGADCE